MSALLDSALEAMKVAETVTRRWWGRRLEVNMKSDQSPVTSADVETEQAIIETLRGDFSDHAFIGEETGYTGPEDAEYTWVIDPIDGTKNFIDGIPLWGTLLALQHEKTIELGVAHLPVMEELAWAERGRGAFFNERRIHVSETTELSEAMISIGSLGSFANQNMQGPIIDLLYSCRRHRSFGDIWPRLLVARGKVDLVIEAEIKFVDVAAVAVIVEEAGGRATDMHGARVDRNVHSFVASNGLLHQAVLEALAEQT
jgi:histidinol-phosphatase